MRKSKIILGCIISVMAFALTLLIGLPSKAYASEIDDYIEENYSNLVYSNNLFNFDDFVSQTMATNGVAIVDYENNTIQLTAEYSDNYLAMTRDIQLKPNTTYTFSVKSSGDYQLFVANPNWVSGISNNSLTFTTDGTGVVSFRIDNDNEIGALNLFSEFMLNQGTQALPYEPYITGSMIYEQAFNKGVEEAMNNNGIWKYIDSVYVGTEADNDYTFDELKSRGFLNGYEINLYSMAIVDNENYSFVNIDFSFNNAPLTELNFFFKGYNSYAMFIYDNAGEVVNVDISELRTLNYEDIITRNSNFGNYITLISIVASSPDSLEIILNNSSYSEGYQNGFSIGSIKGKNEGYNEGYTAGINNQVNNQSNYNAGYNEGYNEGEIAGYNEGYNEGITSNVETNGFKTLFNSILSYPVNMISNVFNFEFMGINIASLIMFIVSIGIVVFVVKKFW